jgi:glutathione S-transferase
MMTLYFSPGACSLASHIGLEETGAPYEAKPTLLAKQQQKTEAYLKINPRGKVPALSVDGKVLVENTAILTYLAKRFPEKKLMPADPLEDRASLVPALHAARALCRRRSGTCHSQGNGAEIVLGQLPGNRLHDARKRLDHGQSVHSRRSVRTGFLRLGRARWIPHAGAQRLHGMARAHDEAPDGVENCRERTERFNIVVRYTLPQQRD